MGGVMLSSEYSILHLWNFALECMTEIDYAYNVSVWFQNEVITENW